MKIHLFFIIIGLLLASYQTGAHKEQEGYGQGKTEKGSFLQLGNDFRFSGFVIGKGQLGPIKKGMTIAQAESFVPTLKKDSALALHFGYDGGGQSYLYYFEEELVFALIPAFETGQDTIVAIAAIHKNLRTGNGLNPNSTVGTLEKQYPELSVHYNAMSKWEEVRDTLNRWVFVFMTDENDQIGAYNDTVMDSKPRLLSKKADWVTIM